jgi:hypothetical protein
MAKSIKPMWAVYGPSGMLATSDGFSEAEKLARDEARRNVGSPYYVLGAVAAFVADPPVVRTVVLQGSDAPAPAPEPEDIIDYMEAKAAVAATFADGWITWTGGENPVPGAMVECFFASKSVPGAPVDSAALRWDWQQGGIGGDITAYRVVRS